MSRRTVIEIAVVVAALAILALGFYSWLKAHDEQMKMQASIAAQEKIISQQKQQMLALADAEKQRDQATQQQIASMRAQVAQLKSAQQIIRWLPQQVPAPEPVKIELPPATKGNPAPAAVATVPQVDLPALRNFVETCKECQLKLSTAQQDLASRDERLKLAGEQLSAMQEERDAAVKALKGGGFWRRLAHNARMLAIGGGIATAAICATGHCH